MTKNAFADEIELEILEEREEGLEEETLPEDDFDKEKDVIDAD